MSEDVREVFEENAKAAGYSDFRRFGMRNYEDDGVQCRWEGYQAATASSEAAQMLGGKHEPR